VQRLLRQHSWYLFGGVVLYFEVQKYSEVLIAQPAHCMSLLTACYRCYYLSLSLGVVKNAQRGEIEYVHFNKDLTYLITLVHGNFGQFLCRRVLMGQGFIVNSS